MGHLKYCLPLLVFFSSRLCNAEFGYSQEQLEMYDLYDELRPTTLYQFMGIERAATKREIKSAWRKKLLVWHPDKAAKTDPETGESIDDKFIEHRFRQLTQVNEIFGDEEMRKAYDSVLDNGLPPGIGFRYVRVFLKLSVWQVCILLTIVVTLVHYVMMWGSYLEKTWTIASAKAAITTKNKKKLKEKTMQMDSLLLEKPSFKNSLPVLTVYFLIYLVTEYPKELKERAERAKQAKLLEAERILDEARREKEAEEERVRKEEERKLNKEKHQKWLDEQRAEAARKYEAAMEEQAKRMAEDDSDLDALDDEWSDSDDSEDQVSAKQKRKNKRAAKKKSGKGYLSEPKELKKGEWDADEKKKLTDLMTRWPGGTPDRWLRIAEELNRSELDVSKQVKNMRATQHQVGKHAVSSDSGWSQEQQTALEEALSVFKKDYDGDRWGAIAGCVTGKTKADCINRYKFLLQKIQERKQAAQQK